MPLARDATHEHIDDESHCALLRPLATATIAISAIISHYYIYAMPLRHYAIIILADIDYLLAGISLITPALAMHAGTDIVLLRRFFAMMPFASAIRCITPLAGHYYYAIDYALY